MDLPLPPVRGRRRGRGSARAQLRAAQLVRLRRRRHHHRPGRGDPRSRRRPAHGPEDRRGLQPGGGHHPVAFPAGRHRRARGQPDRRHHRRACTGRLRPRGAGDPHHLRPADGPHALPAPHARAPQARLPGGTARARQRRGHRGRTPVRQQRRLLPGDHGHRTARQQDPLRRGRPGPLHRRHHADGRHVPCDQLRGAAAEGAAGGRLPAGAGAGHQPPGARGQPGLHAHARTAAPGDPGPGGGRPPAEPGPAHPPLRGRTRRGGRPLPAVGHGRAGVPPVLRRRSEPRPPPRLPGAHRPDRRRLRRACAASGAPSPPRRDRRRDPRQVPPGRQQQRDRRHRVRGLRGRPARHAPVLPHGPVLGAVPGRRARHRRPVGRPQAARGVGRRAVPATGRAGPGPLQRQVRHPAEDEGPRREGRRHHLARHAGR